MKWIYLFLILPLFLSANPIEAKQLFNKKTVSVMRKNITYTKSYYGEVVADESRIYDITLRFSGFVEKLFVTKRYQRVSKGDKLFSIYSDEVGSLLKELRFLNKTSTQKRLKNLSISQKEFHKEDVINIYSPYSGFVIEKNINEGSFAKKGQMLYKIADLSHIWVIAKIYQEDLKDIKIDHMAKIDIKGVGSFKAKLDFIYPKVDKKAKTIDARFVLQNSEFRLFPNMFATVKLSYQKRSVLVLPKSAVFTKGKKHYVFLDKGAEFEPKEITAKRINTYQFEVSGIKEGVKVIDKVMFMLDSDALTNSLYDLDDEDW